MRLSDSGINGVSGCATRSSSRRIISILLVLFTSGLTLYADQPAAADHDDVDYYRVVGAVIDVWGNPLPGAFVKSRKGMEAVTDADGTFSIFLAPDDTKLTASYPGFISKKMNVKNQPVVFELHEENSQEVPGWVPGNVRVRVKENTPR